MRYRYCYHQCKRLEGNDFLKSALQRLYLLRYAFLHAYAQCQLHGAHYDNVVFLRAGRCENLAPFALTDYPPQ